MEGGTLMVTTYTRDVAHRKATLADRTSFVDRHPGAWHGLKCELEHRFFSRGAVNYSPTLLAKYGFRWLRAAHPCVIEDYKEFKGDTLTYGIVRGRIYHWNYKRSAIAPSKVQIQRGVRSNEHPWLDDRNLWQYDPTKYVCDKCSSTWKEK